LHDAASLCQTCGQVNMRWHIHNLKCLARANLVGTSHWVSLLPRVPTQRYDEGRESDGESRTQDDECPGSVGAEILRERAEWVPTRSPVVRAPVYNTAAPHGEFHRRQARRGSLAGRTVRCFQTRSGQAHPWPHRSEQRTGPGSNGWPLMGTTAACRHRCKLAASDKWRRPLHA
jgi:hypothetical protein